MLTENETYREIVRYLADNNEKMSISAVCTYAKKFKDTTNMMNIAQNNFSILMEEIQKYPDLDASETLIRLSSYHMVNALTGLNDDELKNIPIEKLIRETNSLIRASAYKKRIEVQNKEDYEASIDAMRSTIFEVMAKENPELYQNVNDFLKNKKKEGEL